MFRLVYSLIILFVFPDLANGQDFREVEDLRPRWQVYRESELTPYHGQNTSSVYFLQDLRKQRNAYLSIESSEPFYLYINSQLITRRTGTLRLKTDSLLQQYGPNIFLGIYQFGGIRKLKTQLITIEKPDALDVLPRQGNYFFDFVLMGSLIMLIFFTSLYQSNPQLTFDYFNVTKLFSLKDRDENLLTLRITSAINLVFYFFCSLLSAMILIVIMHFSIDRMSYEPVFRITSMGEAFLRWLELSAIILGCLILKLVLLSILSGLFGFKDTAPFQFFHSVRILMLALFLVATLSVLYFSMGIESYHYYGLLKMTCLIFVMGTILIYFKLLARQLYRIFHLFFYLCASEIIPLVILIKVLLY